MEKDKIFFGENGLTSTSASHIANLCKETYSDLECQIENLEFYDETVRLISCNDKQMLKKGINCLAYIPATLDRIAQLKSLIAWLREAIKAKERLMKEVQNSSYEDYGIEVPDAPLRESVISNDDVIAGWNIKKRNRYYYLDTLCATIGQTIHPNGSFSNARKRMYNVINNPRTTSGSGRDMVIYERTVSLNEKEVEDTFMSLQNQYREYQAELNSMKHEVEEAVTNDKFTKDEAYRRAYSEYKNRMLECDVLLTACKDKALQDVQRLKIVIPDSLKSVYDEISKLGK